MTKGTSPQYRLLKCKLQGRETDGRQKPAACTCLEGFWPLKGCPRSLCAVPSLDMCPEQMLSGPWRRGDGGGWTTF